MSLSKLGFLRHPHGPGTEALARRPNWNGQSSFWSRCSAEFEEKFGKPKAWWPKPLAEGQASRACHVGPAAVGGSVGQNTGVQGMAGAALTPDCMGGKLDPRLCLLFLLKTGTRCWQRWVGTGRPGGRAPLERCTLAAFLVAGAELPKSKCSCTC